MVLQPAKQDVCEGGEAVASVTSDAAGHGARGFKQLVPAFLERENPVAACRK
jgi:hypothetical protein